MTNRVTLMEDALTKVQEKLKKELQSSVEKSDEVDQEFTKTIANLTETIGAIWKEKVELENEVSSMTVEHAELEHEYNATSTNLKENVYTLEGELQQLRSEQEQAQKKSGEHTSAREVELHTRMEQQQQKIQQHQQEMLQHALIQVKDHHNHLI